MKNYATGLAPAKHEHHQVPKNWLEDLIHNNKVQFGVEDDCHVSKSTICSNIMRKHFNPCSKDVLSPLFKTVEALVIIGIQVGTIFQLLIV